MRQNDSFLPYTINSAVTGVPSLPTTSLNGQKTRLAMNYILTSHPLQNVTVEAHYRDYDYQNGTQSLLFPSYVQADSTVNNLARQSLPYSYNRQTVGADATWTMHKGDALTFSYDFENMDRTDRDVARSLEHSGSVKLDLNPKKWINLRGAYTQIGRDPDTYILNNNITLLNPQGEGSTAVPMPDGWRLFDEAERTRNKVDGLVEIDATDRFSMTASYGSLQDRFGDTTYGVLGNRTMDTTIDASYLLSPNITAFANYTYERYKTDQRSRQYAGPSGSTQIGRAHV